jgi:hypothetical protein
MECTPTDKPAITQVAVPATATGRAPQPAIVTPPSWKSTVPVLVPEAGAVAVTVAVKVTLCPDTEGLAEELSAVVVLPMITTWIKGAEVLVLKLASPL